MTRMRMLDLFSGRWGWGRAFAARGWEVVGVDLVEPPEIPQGCTFYQGDVLDFNGTIWGAQYDFICASSPCEQFSVHGMKHFHPNPPYPDLGIRLFNHARALCDASGLPYVMENVRAAQKFVGDAVHHWGPFYLWGNAVPILAMQGIKKGMRLDTGYEGHGGRFRDLTRDEKRAARKGDPMLWSSSRSPERREATAIAATIPPELAACVCDYAERLLEKPGHDNPHTLEIRAEVERMF